MFMFHIALSLSLIALMAGSALYVFSARCEGKGTCFAKLAAIIVIVLSILSSICTIYCGVNAWQQGADQRSMCMVHGMKMQDKSMMSCCNSMGNQTNTDQQTDTTTANKH